MAMTWSIGGGLAEQQGLHLDGENDRDEHQERADQGGADGVPDAVVGGQGHADAEQREDQAEQGGEVLEQDDGQLGRLGRADEARPRTLATDVVALDDGRTKGEPLERDRDEQDGDRHPPPVCDRLGVLELVPRLMSANRPPTLNSTIETMNA